MKRLYKRKEPPGAVLEDHSVVQEALVPSMTVFKRAKRNIGTRCHNYRGEKVYLGVRVRMPVRDLLKNIRGSRGVDDLNKGSKKGSGDMKRARPRSRTKATRGEHPVKSLEELATILEVLEDDLRTSCASHSPSQNVPSPDFSAFREPSPTDVIHGDEYDQTTPSPEYYTEFSPSTPEYDVAWSRPDCMFFSLQPSCVGDMQIHSDREQDWFKTKHNLDLNSSAFFWTQLQQEEGWLRAASDAELLTTDEQGRT
ncbi:PREDICTED: uncharacterized protein LOC107105210, partial [Cyprinodon variegatus]|uniref:uncharacterized protein LOC107105210 n=1 Tax=Cyprinodon variegatus TaxID=28743 RepID=UPI000742771A